MGDRTQLIAFCMDVTFTCRPRPHCASERTAETLMPHLPSKMVWKYQWAPQIKRSLLHSGSGGWHMESEMLRPLLPKLSVINNASFKGSVGHLSVMARAAQNNCCQQWRPSSDQNLSQPWIIRSKPEVLAPVLDMSRQHVGMVSAIDRTQMT